MKQEKNNKKRKNYKKLIVRLQIGSITFAVFLLLMVGAFLLTKVYESRKDNFLRENLIEAEGPIIKGNVNVQVTETPAEQGEEGTVVVNEPDISVPIETKTVTISAIGDCVLGSDISFSKENDFDAFYIVKQDLGYFFSKVRDVLGEDDLTIANMEGALTESNQRADKNYAFKGRPSYAQILSSGGVEAVNLANDHTWDYGEQGYQDTITNLENAGVSSFGFDQTLIKDVNGIKVGLVGISQVTDGDEAVGKVEQLIDSVKEQGVNLVIVSFHWGSNGEYIPDDVQKTLAHAAIDHGADLVLGHNPHVLQGIETYSGKKIVYSLGSFCFGGDNDPDDRDTMIFRQTFTFENGQVILDENVNIIPCLLSSVDEYNSYQPVVAQGSEAERISQKIMELSNAIAQ